MKKLLSIFILLMSFTSSWAMKIERVEPISWWIGMEHPLQLMIHGENIAGSTVEVNSADIKIGKIISSDNPNYLFVDVVIDPSTKPGEYIFTFTKGRKRVEVPYVLEARRESPAAEHSLTAADVVYLLMPDRFAKGELPEGLEHIEGKVDREDHNARHGGNLQGMIDNLDYIADLGVTAIWSTPLLEDREDVSYHGYAISDLYRVDPRHGTNEMYKDYVSEAHSKGLKVIMDMVPNHIGVRHWWMEDMPMKDWINLGGEYKQTRYGQTVQLDPHGSKADYIDNRDYWFVESMPDMNLKNEYVLNYMIQNAIWWVEYANLDAIRIDTYPYNDKYKAAEWTKAIKDEYPGISLMGECWVNEPSFVSYWEGREDNKDGYNSELPMVMDFPLQQHIISAITKEGPAGWDEGAMHIYFILAQDFLYNNPEKLLIFASNHDIDRLAHYTKGNAKKQMLVYSLLATMRGIPQLYYGDEQMFKGDPSQGHGSFRIDFPGGWPGDERNLFEGAGRTASEDSMYQHTRKLFQWRKGSSAIAEGEMVHFFPESNENQYVYGRMTDDELVFTALNFNSTPGELKWEKYAELFEGRCKTGIDIVSGKEVTFGEPMILEPYQSLILEIKQ